MRYRRYGEELGLFLRDFFADFLKVLLGLAEYPEVAGDYDLVVGAGLSGACAAISAARQGVKVALIQDRPVLGGI